MTSSWTRPVLVSCALGLATAALVARSAQRTERLNPPAGKFVDVHGVRLHYIERGTGSPIVFLHGNGVTAQDFALSEVVESLEKHHRVLLFDRPGYGYSERPRGTIWGAAAQAEVIAAALQRLEVVRPVVVAHSWATLVGLALAVDHPAALGSLVLLSGYYFPTLRLDVPLVSMPAVPVIGDVLRYTLSPVLGRLLSRVLVGRIFAPSPIAERFKAFPFGMSLRPSQLRAEAEEAALLVPEAAALQSRYASLTIPVALVAGSGDRIVNTGAESERLANVLPRAQLRIVSGAGHMIHHIAPREVIAAIENAAATTREESVREPFAFAT